MPLWRGRRHRGADRATQADSRRHGVVEPARPAVGKVLDGNPVERFAKQLRRQDIDLATSTLNDWVGRVGDMLAFVRTACHRKLLTCGLISLDDTPVRARNAEHPAHVQTGRQWLYLGDINQIAYAEFTPDWKGTHPRRVLDGFSGDIQNDGYAGINPLFVGPDAPQRLGCNDHGRRRFVQALEQGDRRAQPMIDLYSALYHVERTATERNLDAIGRHALRQAESVPLWREFGRVITDITSKVDKKAPLGKAIHYWTRQQPALRAFLDDGRFPISNAHVERLLRVVSTFRKNSLFVGNAVSRDGVTLFSRADGAFDELEVDVPEGDARHGGELVPCEAVLQD